MQGRQWYLNAPTARRRPNCPGRGRGRPRHRHTHPPRSTRTMDLPARTYRRIHTSANPGADRKSSLAGTDFGTVGACGPTGWGPRRTISLTPLLKPVASTGFCCVRTVSISVPGAARAGKQKPQFCGTLSLLCTRTHSTRQPAKARPVSGGFGIPAVHALSSPESVLRRSSAWRARWPSLLA